MTASLLLNHQMLIGCDLFLLTFGQKVRVIIKILNQG